MQKSLEIYNETNRKLKALAYCGFLSGWDINTEMPPKANHEAELSALSEMSYTLQTSDEYSAAVDDLYAHRDELSDVLKHEIEAAVLSKQKLKKVPMDEYVAEIKANMHLSDAEFEEIMRAPTHQHTEYKTDRLDAALRSVLH